MRVLGLQLDIVWENKAANHDKVRALLSAARPQPGTLVVLPEMFATGFTMNLEVAEDTGQSIASIAREYRVNLLAGTVRDRRNEAVLFDAQGRELARYAKMHPFSFAGEAVVPGTEVVVVDCGGFKLAPVVCYDLRFPELFRAGVKRGANLFAVIANWPRKLSGLADSTPRLDHWLTLLKARAIENQSYVIGVNRCGRDPGNDYPGRSQIISPRGEVLADAGETEDTVSAELDLPELQAYRQEFPVIVDVR
jgi:omega-amidase